MESSSKGTLRSILLATAVLSLAGLGCGDTAHYRPSVPDGGWNGTNPDAFVAPTSDAMPIPDGLPSDPEGPTITVTAPLKGATVVDNLLKVEASVTDKDGVDPGSVTVTLAGMPPVVMTPQLKLSDRFEALLELGELSGELFLWVSATDFQGHTSSKLVDFKRDPGPTITFISPPPGGYFKGSLLLEVTVADPLPLKSFTVFIGKDGVPLEKKVLNATTTHYRATVSFDDPFDPPLFGSQVLTATAVNKNGATTQQQRIFHIDDQGPNIVIKNPKEGEIIGGTIELEAEVTDPAGLLPSSVECVIGDGAWAKTVPLVATLDSPDTYLGHFDSRTFSFNQVWPVMSCRASDVLGNEAHYDIQVGLDNGPPIIELHSQSLMFVGRRVSGQLECSHPFDPVGDDAAGDLDLVPQIVPIRARVEDQGNFAPSAKFVPVSSIDDRSVWLYLLADTKQPLLVDTTGDGFCDHINPAVVPLSSQPQTGKAIAVNLGPVPVSGSADFTPWANGVDKAFPFPGCNNGSEPFAPETLTWVSPLTMAISAPDCSSTPALYSIPPAAANDKILGLGLPFDFGANNVPDGWICVGAEATDQAGNLGVSPPLRLWVQKAALVKSATLPGNAGPPPGCTGTFDPATQTADSSKPCKYRTPAEVFPQLFPDYSLRIE